MTRTTRGELLRSGDAINRLIVLGEIGRGARGVVYQAYDPRLDRNVALKLLRGGDDPDALETGHKRLLREAQAMAQVSHPNVVAVHDVGTVTLADRVHVFLEMELMRGETLARRMSRWREDPQWRRGRRWHEIVKVFIAAGNGLAAAHQHGMVHRDFKPANVFVSDEGYVKVMDFGLVRRSADVVAHDRVLRVGPEYTSALDVSLTHTGAILGTPAYMAPEQFRGRDGDSRVDQFAFCIALWEALYGLRPFPGDNVATLARSVLEDAPSRPRGTPDPPGFIRRALARGLSKDPASRFEHMRGLLAALDHDPRLRRRRGLRAFAAGAFAVGSIYALGTWLEPGVLALRIESGPDRDALEIRVDGELMEERELERRLRAGQHYIEFSAPGYEPWSDVFEIVRGQVTTLPVHLTHEQGIIDLHVSPRLADVSLDGRSLDKGVRLDTGDHNIRVTARGAHDVHLRFSLAKERLDLNAYLAEAIVFAPPIGGLALGRGGLGDVDGDGFGDIWNLNYSILTAYSPLQNKTLWEFELSESQDAMFLRMVDGDEDGIGDPLVLGVHDDHAQLMLLSGRALLSEEPDNAILWTADTDPLAVRSAPSVPPVLVSAAGRVIVVATSLEHHRVSAHDLATGKRRWTYASPGETFGVIAGNEQDGGWIAVAHVGGLALLNATNGTVRWRRSEDSFDHKLLETLHKDHLLSHVGRDGSRTWMSAAALDKYPGDDLLVPALDTTLTGPLLALDGREGKSLWNREVIVKDLDIRVRVDGGDGGQTYVQVTVQDGERTSVQLLDGASGRTAATLARRETIVRWPCDGPQRILAYGDGARLRSLNGSPVGEPLPLDKVVRAVCSDWNGDGLGDLVVATETGVVRSFGAEGESWRELGSVSVGREALEIIPLADINRDAKPDFLLRAAGPAVILGTRVLWARSYNGVLRTPPVVADLNGDGAPEVAFFNGIRDEDHLEILDPIDGKQLVTVPETSGFALRSPTLEPGREPGTLDLVYGSVPGKRMIRVRGSDFHVTRLELGSHGLIPEEHGRDSALEPERARWLVTYAGLELSSDHRWLWVSRYERAPQLLGFTRASARPGDDRWRIQSQYSAASGSNMRPRVVQLDDDPGVEVIAAVDKSRLVALEADSNECVWSRWVAADWIGKGPALIDLNGDQRPELLAPTHEGGSTLKCETAARASPPRRSPDLVALSITDGSPLWRLPDAASRVAPVTEATFMGRRWLVGASPTRGLWAANFAGDELWSSPQYTDICTRVVLGDLNGDGGPELVYGTEGGEIRVHDAETGELRWRWSPHKPARQIADPVVVDLDSDTRDEILVATGAGVLYALDGQFI